MENKEERIAWIDIAKGIGIILVVIGHVWDKDNLLYKTIYSFHMPLFFILAGIVYKKGSRNSLWRDRIFLNYIVFSAIFLIVDTIIRVFIQRDYSSTMIIWESYQTVTFYGINVLWFLATLFISKRLFRYVLKIRSIGMMFFLTVTLFLATGYLGDVFCMEIMSKTKIGLLIYYPLISVLRSFNVLIFLLIGFSLKTHMNLMARIALQNQWIFFVVAVAGSVINHMFLKQYDVMDMHTLSYDNLLISLINSLCGSFVVIILSMLISGIPILSKGLRFCGENSINIMVVHNYLFIKEGVACLLKSVKLDCVPLECFLTVMFSTIIAYILKKPLERIIEWMTFFLGRRIGRGELVKNANN